MIAACLSTASFPQHLPSGVAEEQVRFAVHGLTPCDVVKVVQALCSGWLCSCPEGITTNGEAQCVSVRLLAVLTVGECEAEGVLPDLLPTAWTPFQELR